MSPGRALVPYGCACTPAVDNACTTPRTMTTGPASVGGISDANAGEDGQKSRNQRCSHRHVPPYRPNRRSTRLRLLPTFLTAFFTAAFDLPDFFAS